MSRFQTFISEFNLGVNFCVFPHISKTMAPMGEFYLWHEDNKNNSSIICAAQLILQNNNSHETSVLLRS